MARTSLSLGLMIKLKMKYRPRAVFEDFHKRKQRWAVVVAHRRAGKTVACINELIVKALVENKDHGRYAYVAPYASQSKNVAWDYLVRFAEPFTAKLNNSELWVELFNGARIRLFGADNPDSLRGLYLDGVVLDEYADMRPRVWGEIVRPLLSDRRGWAVFIGTPKGHNSFYDICNAGAKSPDWFTKMLRASKTGIIPEDELKDAKRSMSIDQYDQEFECSFEAAIQGAYYGQEMRDAMDSGRITTVDYDPMFPCFTFFDLGYTDDTAIWFAQFIHGEIRVIDYHSSNGKSVEFYVDLLKSKPYKYGMHWLPHDARAKTLASGGKSVIEQMATGLGLQNLKIVPNLSIQDGIQAARMNFTRVWFDREKAEEGIESLRQYQREYDDNKKAFRDKPRHDWTSHGADAFRMMMVAYKESKKETYHEKPIVGVSVGRNEVSLDQMWAETKRVYNTRI